MKKRRENEIELKWMVEIISHKMHECMTECSR